MGIKSFFQNVFKNGASAAYNSIKDKVGNVYGGIRNAVHTVGNVINGVDKFVSDVRGQNIPVVSNLADAVQANPYYRAIVQGSKMVNQAVDTAGEIGKTVDSVLAPTAQAIDAVSSKFKQPQVSGSSARGIRTFG